MNLLIKNTDKLLKTFMKILKKGYNNIREAEEDFNRPIREFIKRQIETDPMYLFSISENAKTNLTEQDNLFEYVAELFVKRHNNSIGSAELNLIKEVFKL
ncbi:MAG: hypothetical protein ACLRVE_00660 [Finegoldia magna]|uniref:hypothetical protein n=1 Tax=Finegoldia magna TaxID=1260 RepID=UPI0039A2C880